MDYAIFIGILLIPCFLILAPFPGMLLLTLQRVRMFKKKGGEFRFQYQIGDLLTATFCIAISGIILRQIYQGLPYGPSCTLYFIAATAAGAAAGKTWHLSTLSNSFQDGPTYIIIGTALWILAALIPTIGVAMFQNGLFPNC